MAPKPKTYEFEGKEYTAEQLAKIRGCTTENMRLLINRYGMPAAMSVRTRNIKSGKYASRMKSPDSVALKPFDKTLELKRRIAGWLNQGMSFDEIVVKVRMI